MGDSDVEFRKGITRNRFHIAETASMWGKERLWSGCFHIRSSSGLITRTFAPPCLLSLFPLQSPSSFPPIHQHCPYSNTISSPLYLVPHISRSIIIFFPSYLFFDLRPYHLGLPLSLFVFLAIIDMAFWIHWLMHYFLYPADVHSTPNLNFLESCSINFVTILIQFRIWNNPQASFFAPTFRFAGCEVSC